jgi:hypothetical protein
VTAEATTHHTGSNGDLPTDEVDEAVTVLVKAADAARAEYDALKAQLAVVSERVSRYDRAVRALTEDRSKYGNKKPGPKPKSQLKNKGNADYAPGQPMVGQERLDAVLAAMQAIGHPAGTAEVSKATGFPRQTIAASFAHLRHRGLARRAGTTDRGGHLYAVWHEGDPRDTEDAS